MTQQERGPSTMTDTPAPATPELSCGYFAPCELEADHDAPHSTGMYPEWQVPTIEPLAFIHPARSTPAEALDMERTIAQAIRDNWGDSPEPIWTPEEMAAFIATRLPLPGERPMTDTPAPTTAMDDLLQEAWGVIANAGWDEQERSPGWQEAAERWRDRYHAYLSEARATAAETLDVLDSLGGWARSHSALMAGRGNVDDIEGFIAWYRARRTEGADE